MKFADLNSAELFYTTSSVPMARNVPALIVELENDWALANNSGWSRHPVALRPRDTGGQREQRVIPTVTWEGRETEFEQMNTRLRQAAEIARPLLVAGNAINDIARAVEDGVDDVTHDSGARSFVAFRMLRAQAFDCTYLEHLDRAERGRIARAEYEQREAAARKVRTAARDRVAPIVTAAAEASGEDRWHRVDLEGDRPQLTWEQLAAIVDEAARQARAGSLHGEPNPTCRAAIADQLGWDPFDEIEDEEEVAAP